MRMHGAVVGRRGPRFRSVTKLTTMVRIGRGYLWGSFLIAAAALKTPTRNGYNAQGVNLNSRASHRGRVYPRRICSRNRRIDPTIQVRVPILILDSILVPRAGAGPILVEYIFGGKNELNIICKSAHLFSSSVLFSCRAPGSGL